MTAPDQAPLPSGERASQVCASLCPDRRHPVWRGLSAVTRQTLLAAVRGYRFLLKPWLGNACRFEPTCSAYALQALERHGAAAGTYLTVGRILRCQPWCAGGCDPVPESAPPLFTRLISKTRP